MSDRGAAVVALGQLRDFPEGSLVPMTTGGRSLIVARLGDEVYVALNRCPHRGLPLAAEGRPIDDPGGVIRCPWHGSRFDVRTGASLRTCTAYPRPASRHWTRRPVVRRLGGLEQLQSTVDSAGQVVVELPDAQAHARSGTR